MDSGTLRKASLAPDEGQSNITIHGCNKGNPFQSIKSIVSEEEIKEEIKVFRALFPTIISDVTEGLGELEEARKRITDCFFYNVEHGKRMYCLSTILAYKLIVGKENCSSEKLFLARVLSWCVHMSIISITMADDIMDRSVTRGRILCWYRKEGVGMTAVNDICYIQNSIYHIVKKYFSSCDCYTNILDVFTEVSREVFIAQYLDILATPPMNKKPNLRNFTLEKYTEIAKAKTSCFTAFSLALALYLNDFLDCFGDIAETGKTANDIETGKCTWLIVTALQKASESQLKILEENYGVGSPNCKEKVEKVYKDLKLDEMYLEFDKRQYIAILEEAQQLSNDEKLSFLQPVIIYIAYHTWEGKNANE